MATFPRLRHGFLRSLLLVPVLAILLGLPAGGWAQTWTQTAGGTYSWNDNLNWSAAFPNGAAAAANISADFAGPQTINLNTAITVGQLTIDDTGVATDSAITIAPNGGSLTFDNSGSAATLTVPVRTLRRSTSSRREFL